MPCFGSGNATRIVPLPAMYRNAVPIGNPAIALAAWVICSSVVKNWMLVMMSRTTIRGTSVCLNVRLPPRLCVFDQFAVFVCVWPCAED